VLFESLPRTGDGVLDVDERPALVVVVALKKLFDARGDAFELVADFHEIVLLGGRRHRFPRERP
jgi:hypothetical protein